MKIKCLIIDDEPLARKRLQKLVEGVEGFQLMGEIGTGKEAVMAIKKLKPDFIFLDIEMKDMTGFDVLGQLDQDEQPLVVFVTAYDQYALKAFEFYAFDYLLKPFKKERFDIMVKNVNQHLEANKAAKRVGRLTELVKHFKERRGKPIGLYSRIAIRTGRSVSFIEVKDIRYVTASGSYVDICTSVKTIVHRSSLRQLLEEVQDPNLIRIHRSTVINLAYLTKVVRNSSGDFEVLMSDGKLLRVSKSYRYVLQVALGMK